MNKRLQFVLMGVGLLFMTGVTLGAWVLSHQAQTGYTISSSGSLSFSDDFGIDNIDTGNSSFTKTEYVNVSNNDGPLNVNITLDVNVTDVVDACNNSGDVEVNASWNGITLMNNSAIMTANSGSNLLGITTYAKKYACPQFVVTTATVSN